MLRIHLSKVVSPGKISLTLPEPLNVNSRPTLLELIFSSPGLLQHMTTFNTIFLFSLCIVHKVPKAMDHS